MIITSITLQNFRSYIKSEFKFSPQTTLVIGKNTAGKTNLLEAVHLLLTGKSFRAEKERELIRLTEQIARISGLVSSDEEVKLELVLSKLNGSEQASKKYLVSGVAKRRADFASFLPVVQFLPEDVSIISGSPGKRRDLLDEVLEQTDPDYDRAITAYQKALRQRNALLEKAKNQGGNLSKQFEYWDEQLIQNGQYITQQREELISFFNSETKEVIDFATIYDKSLISKERLLQYENEERFAGVTLVGPHRDDVVFELFSDMSQTAQPVKTFGSRGQQRLVMFQLRLLQVRFIQQKLGVVPLLLLDDIFSELDENNIIHVLKLLGNHQTIVTTTHKEFVPKKLQKEEQIIELGI